MKRLLFVVFACLSLCSYAQMPLSTEVVTGSFEALYNKTANLEIEYVKIHNRSEAEFAEYEKDWVVDKPEVEDLILQNANAALKSVCHLNFGKESDWTVKVVVTTISPKGDYSFVVQLIDKKGEIVGSIAGLFGKGGMFGTKLNLIKDGAKSTGKKLGTILRKYI
jgi:hypothetical protein